MARTMATLLALAALATMAPTAQSDLRATSWLDVAYHEDYGMGKGLYDPGTPPGSGPAVYCQAMVNWQTDPSPGQAYYRGLRYWTPPAGGNGAAPMQVNSYTPEPSNCGGLVPNNHYAWDSYQYDWGAAFWSLGELAPTEVVSLQSTVIWVNYCLAPSANAGPNAVVLVPAVLEAFGAQTLDCGGFAGSHQLYPGCPFLSGFVAPGQFGLGNPVFHYDGGCNSLKGSPVGTDFAVQHCMSSTVFDLASGLSGNQEDEDHFVVARDGSLAPWALAFGTWSALFPNVSNQEPNDSAC